MEAVRGPGPGQNCGRWQLLKNSLGRGIDELGAESGQSTHQPGQEMEKRVPGVPGEKMGHERARNPQGGQCFCVAGQGSGHLSQGPAGHVRGFELIPEGDRELVKAVRQKSVRIQEAFLKAHSSRAMGREGDG